ncbi:MAG TPA: CHASE2 domain-containing protein [Steroidobacteraceae bacterium]|nr:CHASE2 domain-containing protein [Steroidobacteraceae bacterium]
MGKQRSWVPRNAYTRAGLLVLASASLLLAANWLRLLNAVGLDNLLERQLLSAATHSVQRAIGQSIRLIYLEEKGNGDIGDFAQETDRQCLRQRHAQLLGKLERAGARVVAFDLVFPPAVQKCVEPTEAFAAAIRDARARGQVQVIVGHDPAADLDPRIGDAATGQGLALVRVGREQRDAKDARFLTGVLLAEADEVAGAPGTVLVRPLPLPLAMYMADRWPGSGSVLPGLVPESRQLTFTATVAPRPPVTVDVRDCNRGELNCPAAADAAKRWYGLLPVWMGEGAGFIERSYASVILQEELGADYRDKVVLVGARIPEEVVALAPDSKAGKIWGYHVHARALADLQSDTYLRRPSFAVISAIVVVLVLVGIGARLWLPRLEMRVSLPWIGTTPIPVGLILVALLHGFLVIQLMQRLYWLQDLSYQLLALAAGYYVASRPLLPKSA